MSEENKQPTLGVHIAKIRRAARLAEAAQRAVFIDYKRQTWTAAINGLQGTNLSEDEAMAFVRQDMYGGSYHEIIGRRSAALYFKSDILAFVGASITHDETTLKRQFFVPAALPEGKAL